MAQTQVAPYGSWRSPISSDLIVRGVVGLKDTALDGDDVYWLESRPGEGGRSVIVHRSPDGRVRDLTPQPFNARTRVHEYGGGDFVVHDGTVYFSNFDDQRLYSVSAGDNPEPLTAQIDHRYANMAVDVVRNRLVAVREDHTGDGEPVNEIVAIDLGDGAERVLVSGNDFYSSPRVGPDGQSLAWLTWNHPNMPWDGTELWTAGLGEDGAPVGAERVEGGPDESVFQPEWSPDGTLHFVSDRTGWWNLYRLRAGAVEPLCPMEAEFGLPGWAFGMSTYAFLSPTRIACASIERGVFRLGVLDTETGELAEAETPYSVISFLRSDPATGGLLFIAGSPTESSAVVRLDTGTGEREVVRRAGDLGIDPGYLSAPETVEFPTEGGLTAHGFFYPPANKDHAAPEGELPPLLVLSHGGPTGMTLPNLDLEIQHRTSRGFAVLDVNYGGSTGYGREYRRRLDGMWGVVDVDDCANGAKYLAGRGLVDGGRLLIAGGSAGGYTTLCALAFRDTFAAGASHYGVSDAAALAEETHKFESRYLDGLIGPYPERADLYRERSPIHHTEGLSCPVIFFQGLEDEVVPPNQAQTMFEALKEKGLPVAYVPFEGEQHGFRRAENIKRALDGELFFYSRVFGFDLADRVDPIRIENLDAP
ncbi:MAG: Prolyl oligopeptidase family protein [uncultured Rubrobacteraceae bacterium]|uniref:Prolyl oligopeptidase family protein n=1 Tax=uncultured Rubrobacteraceae bacterium TaxID=349277 RepID=A0A6J4R319_9ACTN|nr:MAG: Prolyl oligopeptidase family protein [uncultured Rubrobacteraceae bacterium]